MTKSKIRKRALAALDLAGIDPASCPALAALIDYAAQNAGLDARNYFSSWSDRDGRRAYNEDGRSILNDWRDVKRALADCGSVGVLDAEVIEASKSAFSGRMTWTGDHWDYCTGQYWPTEYRRATAVVLEQAARLKRQSLPPETMTMITSIAELAALNKRNGGCWFDKGSMRFFGTSFESGIVRGKYFITSEQPPHGSRKYSIRSFDAEGNISTVGGFCHYDTKAEARAALKAL